MDAKTLGWLADTVKEAIATATAPLNAQIETLTAQLQQLQNSQTPGYDDTEIKRAVQALREVIPAPYDDGEIRQQFKQLAEAVGESAKLADRIEEVAKSVPAAYDDKAIREQLADLTVRTNAHAEIVKGYAENLPKPYDDTALRQEIAESLKFQTESFESVLEQFKQLPKPADGRDALQLEVLPAIDEQKSYTRGTYAKHAGGLWRAFEQTSGMRGWECIVEGVKELQVDMVDKRLSVKAVMSSGALAEMVKELPIQIYRGVFKSEDPYHQGDTVTWAGSLWHCNATGTKALPGDGSADWTLAVKKGRDGREVVKTERKEGPVQL